MRMTLAVVVLSTAASIGGFTRGHAQVPANDAAAARCEQLGATDFSRIPDAPTQVIARKEVKPTDDRPGYCEVSGYVAPSVGFLLRMPSENWNGKLLELGCGGACGSTAHISACEGPLRRGYACIASDGGHQSSGLDMKWAFHNPQAVTDYFVRSSHVSALAGKALVERFYDQPPRKSYFMGCSAGGIQAMWAAQRFPWDYDGIVAGAPALSVSSVWMNWVWANRALIDEDGVARLGQTDLERLHQAVVAKCDVNDGIRDGVIGDARQCRFDPAELRCPAGGLTRCLTAQQVAAVKRIYGGPVTEKGEQIALPTALPGSERTWLNFFGGSSRQPTPASQYVGDWFRYFGFQPNPGPTWEFDSFDFDRDYQRLGMAAALEPLDPDLRRFKARGGKLLMYTGWSDAIEGVLRTVDYYETAEKLMGGRTATQDFFRLFVVPGMSHCTGGEGPFAIDYLSALEAWVENGETPDKLIGAHLKDGAMVQFPLDPTKIEFSRPIYPYPQDARYRGRGDPRDAANFEPRSRTDEEE